MELFKLHASTPRSRNKSHFNRLLMMPEIFAERIRIQNLRFAYFLCDAQKVSDVIKS